METDSLATYKGIFGAKVFVACDWEVEVAEKNHLGVLNCQFFFSLSQIQRMVRVSQLNFTLHLPFRIC